MLLHVNLHCFDLLAFTQQVPIAVIIDTVCTVLRNSRMYLELTLWLLVRADLFYAE